jgi:hypothetical protein
MSKQNVNIESDQLCASVNKASKKYQSASEIMRLFDKFDKNQLPNLIDKLSDQSLKQILRVYSEFFQKVSNQEQVLRLWTLSPQHLKDHPMVQNIPFALTLKALNENPNVFLYLDLSNKTDRKIKNMVEAVFSSKNLNKALISQICDKIPEKIQQDKELWQSILSKNIAIFSKLTKDIQNYIFLPRIESLEVNKDANDELCASLNKDLEEKKSASEIMRLFDKFDKNQLPNLIDKLSDQSLKQILPVYSEFFQKVTNAEQVLRLWTLSPQHLKDHPMVQNIPFALTLKALNENPNVFLYLDLSNKTDSEIKNMVKAVFSSKNLNNALISQICEKIPEKIQQDKELWQGILSKEITVFAKLTKDIQKYILPTIESELMVQLIKNHPESITLFPEVSLEFLKINPLCYQFLSPEDQLRPELASVAFQHYEQLQQDIPQQLWNDTFTLDHLFEANPQTFFQLVKEGVIPYSSLSENLKNRSDLAIAALIHNIENITLIPKDVLDLDPKTVEDMTESLLFIKQMSDYVPDFFKLAANGTIDYDALSINQKAQYLHAIDDKTLNKEISERVHQGLLFNDFVFTDFIIGRPDCIDLLQETLAARPDLHIKIFNSFVNNPELHNLYENKQLMLFKLLNKLSIPIDIKMSIIEQAFRGIDNQHQKALLKNFCIDMTRAEIESLIEETEKSEYKELGISTVKVKEAYQRIEDDGGVEPLIEALKETQQQASPESGFFSWVGSIIRALEVFFYKLLVLPIEKTVEEQQEAKKAGLTDKIERVTHQINRMSMFNQEKKEEQPGVHETPKSKKS